jgi:uncharacterized protein (TIGR03546 family)
MDAKWWNARLLLISAYLRSTLVHESPKLLAVAVTLGAFVGLLPLGNIVGLVLITVLFVHPRLNSGVGVCSALTFALVGFWWEPFLHRTGYLVLTCTPLTPLWAALYDFPFAAWTGFNQTLVMGDWITGLYLLTPVYLLCLWLLDRYRRPVIRYVKHHRWGTWIWLSDFAGGGDLG